MSGARDGMKTREAIREVAADLFFEHGYEATSLRAVAAGVGIQVGSLYNHISGKDELLTDIMVSVMDTLEPDVMKAADAAGPGAVARLRAALDAHIRYHAEHAREVFIGNSELRSLSSTHRKAVLARRRQYEQYIRELVQAAAEETGVDLLNARLQTYAILALGMHVSSWYRPGGPLGLDEVVELFTRISLRQIGVEDSGAAPVAARRSRRSARPA